MLAQPSITIATVLLLSYVSQIHCFHLPRTAKVQSRVATTGHHSETDDDDANNSVAAPSPSSSSSSSSDDPSLSRKSLLDKTKRSINGSAAAATAAALALVFTRATTPPAYAKCTDIESCREEGERKVEAELIRNPIVRLSDGVRYRVLRPPPTSPSSSSSEKVTKGSNIDLIYSITTASGQYMYSKGFGYEKVDFGGRPVSDLGLDSLAVANVGSHSAIPTGIEYALLGMQKGERRRVELPPDVGFATSNWSPEPMTRMGKAQMEQYRRKLMGFGSQPPFPAETVWDVEVMRIRN